MKLEKWALVAEIISSAAVLMTLAYLAVQTAQNTAAVQASTRQAMLAEDRELLTLHFGHPELMQLLIRDLGSLSDNEKSLVATYLTIFVRNRENQWLQYQNGVIDEATWAAYAAPIAPNLSNQVSRNWWKNRSADGEFHPGFTAFVNELLSETPVRIGKTMAESSGID